MLYNNLINNTINITNKYNHNIIWGYIDIYKGNIILSSPQLCIKIENHYKNNKDFINIDLLNTTIFFKNKLKQITNNKKHSVFRIITSKMTINKTLVLKNDKYYLYKKQNHIGLLIDYSIISNYDKHSIYDIFLKHQSISESNRLYLPEQNSINIKKMTNYNDLFTNNNESIFDNFIDILLNITQNYYNKEDVYIYILTTTENYNLLLNIYDKLKNRKLIHNDYNIIQLNFLNDLEYINMY